VSVILSVTGGGGVGGDDGAGDGVNDGECWRVSSMLLQVEWNYSNSCNNAETAVTASSTVFEVRRERRVVLLGVRGGVVENGGEEIHWRE